ncbi:hypothetical protein SLA2020_284890 [Shorea laevis]
MGKSKACAVWFLVTGSSGKESCGRRVDGRQPHVVAMSHARASSRWKAGVDEAMLGNDIRGEESCSAIPGKVAGTNHVEEGNAGFASEDYVECEREEDITGYPAEGILDGISGSRIVFLMETKTRQNKIQSL